MNKRQGKVVRFGRSLGVILPKDWVRGNEIEPGDLVDILYEEDVTIRKPVKQLAEAGGGR